jgi:hypothetical protein
MPVTYEPLPSIRPGKLIANAKIENDQDNPQPKFSASDDGEYDLPVKRPVGPSICNPGGFDTCAWATFRAAYAGIEQTSTLVSGRFSMSVDVGGQCGNSAKKAGVGGSGGVNPNWDAALLLPGDTARQVWIVRLTSDIRHTVKDAAVTLWVDSMSKGVTSNGSETAEFRVTPGRHVVRLIASGANPYFGCGGAPNGTRHNEQQRFDVTIEARRESDISANKQ